MENEAAGLMGFLPLIFIGMLFAIVANMLAREKGRNVTLWTVLGLIPFVGYVCMPFFVGAANL